MATGAAKGRPKSPEPANVQPQTLAVVRLRPLLAHEETDMAEPLWTWESDKLFRCNREGPPMFEGGQVSECENKISKACQLLSRSKTDVLCAQVYGPEATTEEFFEKSVLPAVHAAFKGTTATVWMLPVVRFHDLTSDIGLVTKPSSEIVRRRFLLPQVLAYGEASSGKSHSLMGSQESAGIIW